MSDKTAIREFVEKFWELRNVPDTDGMFAMMSPEFHFYICGTDQLSPLTQHASDPEQVRTAITALVRDWDLSGVKALSIHVDGETAFVHRRGEIRHIPSGQVINTEFLDKITVRDGSLVEYIEFVDTFLIARTCGLV